MNIWARINTEELPEAATECCKEYKILYSHGRRETGFVLTLKLNDGTKFYMGIGINRQTLKPFNYGLFSSYSEAVWTVEAKLKFDQWD